MGEEIEIYILKKLDDAIQESKASSEFHFAARLFLPKLHKDFTELKELIEKKRNKIRLAAAAAAAAAAVSDASKPSVPPISAVTGGDATAIDSSIPASTSAAGAKEDSKVLLPTAGDDKERDASLDAGDEKESSAPSDAGASLVDDDTKEKGAPSDAGDKKEIEAPSGASSDEKGTPSDYGDEKETGAPLDAVADDKKEVDAPSVAGDKKEVEAPSVADDKKEVDAPSVAGDKKEVEAPSDAVAGDKKEPEAPPSDAVAGDKTEVEAPSDAVAGDKKELEAPSDAVAGDKKEPEAPSDAGDKKEVLAPSDAVAAGDKKEPPSDAVVGDKKAQEAPSDALTGDKKEPEAPSDAVTGDKKEPEADNKELEAPSDAVAGDKKELEAPSDAVAGDKKELEAPSDAVADDKKEPEAPSDAVAGDKKELEAPSDAVAGDKKELDASDAVAGDKKELHAPVAGDKKEPEAPSDAVAGDKKELDAPSDAVAADKKEPVAADKKEPEAPSDAVAADKKEPEAPSDTSDQKETSAPLADSAEKDSVTATDHRELETPTSAAGGGKKEPDVGTSAKTTSQDDSEISPAIDTVKDDKSITPPASAGDADKVSKVSKTATLDKTSSLGESEISPVTDDDATDYKSKTLPTTGGDGKKDPNVPPTDKSSVADASTKGDSNTVVTKVNEEDLLREQLYYLNNVLTEWQMITKKPFSFSSDSVSSIKDLSKTLKKIKQDLKPEKTDESTHSATPPIGSGDHASQIRPAPEVVEFRWSTRLVNHEKVHGFQDKILSLERLVVLRRKDTDTFKAFGLHGMAGVGKTTLCQSIFNRPKVSEYFFPRIWVCLSKQKGEDEDNRKEVVKRMLRCLGIDDNIITKVDQKQSIRGLLFALRLQLTGKRYLIVLDDAHNTDEWFKMANSDAENDNNKIYEKFSYGLPKECGGTVIVTSRVEQVVKNMVGDEENLRCIEPLTDQDTCWSIFKDTVMEDKTPFPEDLNKLRAEIVKRCDGLPLAAKLLGQIKHKELRENPIAAVNQRAAVQAGLTGSSSSG